VVTRIVSNNFTLTRIVSAFLNPKFPVGFVYCKLLIIVKVNCLLSKISWPVQLDFQLFQIRYKLIEDGFCKMRKAFNKTSRLKFPLIKIIVKFIF